jgi:hypothetical protein
VANAPEAGRRSAPAKIAAWNLDNDLVDIVSSDKIKETSITFSCNAGARGVMDLILGAASPHGAYWLPFFLAFAAILTTMRVLMVWVYRNTGSVLLAQLMHASSTASVVVLRDPHTCRLRKRRSGTGSTGARCGSSSPLRIYQAVGTSDTPRGGDERRVARADPEPLTTTGVIHQSSRGARRGGLR